MSLLRNIFRRRSSIQATIYGCDLWVNSNGCGLNVLEFSHSDFFRIANGDTFHPWYYELKENERRAIAAFVSRPDVQEILH